MSYEETDLELGLGDKWSLLALRVEAIAELDRFRGTGESLHKSIVDALLDEYAGTRSAHLPTVMAVEQKSAEEQYW